MPFKFTGTLKRVGIQLTDAKLTPEEEAEIQRIRAEIRLREQRGSAEAITEAARRFTPPRGVKTERT